MFEIDAADAWADLCRRYPLEVTAQKRHAWYRTTDGDVVEWMLDDNREQWLRKAAPTS